MLRNNFYKNNKKQFDDIFVSIMYLGKFFVYFIWFILN